MSIFSTKSAWSLDSSAGSSGYALLAAEPPPDDRYAEEVHDWAGRNADIESFATHARVLVDFFFEGGSPVAADFFEDRSEWPSRLRPRTKSASLRDIRRRVGIEVAHLSYQRNAPPEEWGYEQIWADLVPLIRLFIENASPDRLSREFCVAVERLLPPPARESNVKRGLISEPRWWRSAVGATTAPPYVLSDEPTAPHLGAGTAVIPPKPEEPGFGD